MIKRWRWILGGIALLIVLATVASFFVDEPLRRYMEREMNQRLKGYSVRIGGLDLHPLNFSLDLKEVWIIQDAHPEPPVAQIPRLHASVHWRELLTGHLVGDVQVDRPRIHLNLKHIRRELKEKVPVRKRGWQEALQAVYPITVNAFSVRQGDLTYVDEGPSKPLRLRQIDLRAENIRNIRSPKAVFPSPLRIQGLVFDSGSLLLEGRADFLAEPHVGLQADLKLENIDLGFFRPIAQRYHLDIRQGLLSAAGRLEFAPRTDTVHLINLTIRQAAADFVHRAETEEREKEVARKTARKAEELTRKPQILIRIDELKVAESILGLRNLAAKPPYRVFLSDLEVDLKNFSNQFVQGPARVRLEGKFMGTGKTMATGTFRPEPKGPDFSVRVAIEDTDMRAMNDLLRAYGKFDVTAGLFSFYSELTVRNRKVEGYVKPLFRDMKVYDRRQDKEKSLFRKLYEGLVGGVSKLLENPPRREVATKAPVYGRLEDPQTSTWVVLVRLFQNAFFRAILPGFERGIRSAPRRD